jgi:hypothetical protein
MESILKFLGSNREHVEINLPRAAQIETGVSNDAFGAKSDGRPSLGRTLQRGDPRGGELCGSLATRRGGSSVRIE